MARSTSVQPGEELRGWRVKLYPTQDQLYYLAACQQELMSAWNVLVTSRETHVDHCVRYAEDHGLIGPLPTRPTTERTTNVPDEIAEWETYEKLCAERRYKAVAQTRQVEGLRWEDWRVDYKKLRELFGGRESLANAQMYLSLVDTFRKTKGPNLKKHPLKMPLLNRTGGHAIVFDRGEHGTRTTASGATRLTGSRNCTVKFGPVRIKARFHREPPGPFIEGISIKLEQDGWYASAKCRVVPTKLEEPTREVIAINPGLECLYADDTGHVVENPRGNAYSLRVRELSNWVDEAPTPWDEVYRRNQQGRYQERFARRTEDLIYSEILPRLAPYDTILVAEAGKRAAQGVQTRISRNDEGGYVSAMSLMTQLIVQRYGLYDPEDNPSGRVRVIQSMGISRRCSQCGTEHSSRYQRDNSRRRDQQTDCPEPSCRARIHVDVNAARNLLSNYLDLQRAAE